MISKNMAFISRECVACGNCVKTCPRRAISIFKGMYAVVNSDLCVGCKKCEGTCTADVITIKPRGGKIHE